MTTGCLKSPISLMGGKSLLTGWLCRYVPGHRLYCEPFAGGAKLFFAKEPSVISVLNDVNDMLVNLYRCIQNTEKRQRLMTLLNETPYARSVFQAWKYGDETPQSDVEMAARFFYLCKSSFAGDIERGGFAIPSKGTNRNPAQTYQNSIGMLEIVSQKLKGVTLECLDFQACIRRYDSPDTLFYCDPPYLGAGHYYERGNFTQEDHHYRLSEILHNVQAAVMVSHYECDTYNLLYQGWNKYTFESFKGSSKAYSGESKPVTIECLWTNFEARKIQKALWVNL
ncbi:MAG: hypothetical protein HW390_3054 [Candidatus Brocadiaceae bacterium]|nr:hypothetical protein [Candidatus Brocadiaceae bacterium]